MKKLLFLLMVMYLLSEKSFSQVEIRGVTTILTDGIQSDSVNLSPNKEFEKRIKLKPINDSENKVEIRFYKHQELSSTKDLKVLELKGDTWKGTQYSESNYPKVKIKQFRLEAPKGFPELVKMLLKHNLTRLPSQEELKPRMKKYGEVHEKRGRAEKVIFVSDGYSYTVEFKIGDTFRVYTFSNPEIYADFYDDVQELKDYVGIMNIFETELKKK